MIIPSLQSFAEQFQCVVATLSEQDWSDNLVALSKIRILATKPREKKTSIVPEQASLDRPASSAKTLSELLKLPVHGQVTPEEVQSGLALLKSERDITDHCSNMGMGSSAIKLVKTVFHSFTHEKEVFEDIWNGSRFYETDGTPECRLLEAHHSIFVEGHVNGARYRINALVFACVYYSRVERLGTAANRETLILRKLEEESGKSHFQINDILKRGRWYLAWVNKLGIGAIFALGESFATRMRMRDIDQLVDACKSIQGFHQRSSDLSSIARRAIEQAIARSHGNQNHGEITNGPGQRCIEYPGPAEASAGERTEDFGAERPCRDEATGLQALVVAAGQIESCKAGHASIATRHRPTRDTQTQQHLRAQNEGLIAEQVPGLPPTGAGSVPAATYGQHIQSPWQMHRNHDSYGPAAAVANSQPPENQLQCHPRAADLSPPIMTGVPGARSMILPHQASASNHNFSADTVASSDGTATVGTPGAASTPMVLGNHALQSRWSTYAEQIPSQRSLPQHAALYGVQGFAHQNLDDASMTTGQQSPPSGCWPVATSRGLHGTMAPHFLPDNDANGIYHGTGGGGCTIDDEWMRVVEELFTQHGDDTSYPS